MRNRSAPAAGSDEGTRASQTAERRLKRRRDQVEQRSLHLIHQGDAALEQARDQARRRDGSRADATAAAVGIGCYLVRFQFSRVVPPSLAFLIGIPVLRVLGRVLLRRSIHRARTIGALQHRVVIAGAEGHVDEIAAVLGREKWLGYNVIGALTPEPGDRSAYALRHPAAGILAIDRAGGDRRRGGPRSSSSPVVRSAPPSRCAGWPGQPRARGDVAVVIAPSDAADVSSERISVRPVGGLPLIHLAEPRSQDAVRRAERTFDVIGTLGLMLLFSPLFAFSALRVWSFDRGPILFRQMRVGRDGAAFYCWKFRTMVTNAEELLAGLHNPPTATTSPFTSRALTKQSSLPRCPLRSQPQKQGT